MLSEEARAKAAEIMAAATAAANAAANAAASCAPAAAATSSSSSEPKTAAMVEGTGTNGDAAAARRRKRKSRWGQRSEGKEEDSKLSGALVVSGAKAGESAADAGVAKPKKKRRSRWGSAEEKVKLPPQLAALASSQNLTAAQTKMMLLKLQLQEVSAKILNPKAYINKEAMSPSPEPTYDQNGMRTNTREIRFQKKIMAARQKILDEMVKIDPTMAQYVPKSTEWIKLKLLIPVDKHPDYNFIGLIIGPRGNTQKRLQKETGAKIFVRGREPGNRKMNRPYRPEDDEPLHVLITARDQESVDKAKAIIEKLLVPVADSENKHKAMQLKELAAMNGTALDIITCRTCGESGHRQADCPKKAQGGSGWVPANIKCAICGSDGHPTIDCPNRNTSGKTSEQLNSEYSQFMAELGGAEPASGATTGSERKSGASSSQPAKRGLASPGSEDWKCVKCSNSNYAFRTRCNRCGAHRKESDPTWQPPQPLPPTNGGANELDPNDWICKTCGIKNYSFRRTCNRCVAPKPGSAPPPALPPRPPPGQFAPSFPPQGRPPWGNAPPHPSGYGYGYPGYGMHQAGYGMPRPGPGMPTHPQGGLGFGGMPPQSRPGGMMPPPTMHHAQPQQHQAYGGYYTTTTPVNAQRGPFVQGGGPFPPGGGRPPHSAPPPPRGLPPHSAPPLPGGPPPPNAPTPSYPPPPSSG